MFNTPRSLFDEACFCQKLPNAVFLSPQRSRTSGSRATQRLFGRRACRSSSRSECCGTELRQRSSTLSPRIGPPSTITWLSGPRPKSRETTSTKKVTERIDNLLHRTSLFVYLYHFLVFFFFFIIQVALSYFFFLVFLFLAVFCHLLLNVVFYFINRVVQGIRLKLIFFS